MILFCFVFAYLVLYRAILEHYASSIHTRHEKISKYVHHINIISMQRLRLGGIELDHGSRTRALETLGVLIHLAQQKRALQSWWIRRDLE